MAIYTITTTAEQEVLLGIMSKQSGQTAQQIVSEITTQALATFESQQEDGFLAAIRQNDGLQTLSDLAAAAQANPNPNVQTKV